MTSERLKELLAAAEGALPSAEEEAHLSQCVECQRRLSAAAGKLDDLPRLADEKKAESVVLAKVIDQLERMGPRPGYQRRATRAGDQNPSRRYGKYALLKTLGTGGMGTVYEALDTTLDRHVAIKIPAAELLGSEEGRQRFLREARTIAALEHEHIVRIHAAEEIDDTLLLVMELVRGESLADRLQREGYLSWLVATKIAWAVSDALHSAHERQFIHRDIKPANILFDEEARSIKLTDFGLAKTAVDTSLTTTGVIAGTPEYMAPEQARTGQAAAAADVFSLGVALYHAVSGVSPFRAATPLATLEQVCQSQPPRLDQLDAEVPEWFGMLIAEMMSKDPQQRPTAEGVKRRLAGSVPSGFASSMHLRSVPATKTDESDRGTATFARAADHLARYHVTGPLTRPSVRWAAGASAGLLLLCTLAIVLLPQLRFVTSGSAKMRDSAGRVEPEEGPGGAPAAVSILGREAVFDSLAAAIEAASDDDTIVVADMGPHRLDGLDLGERRLTIRAAEGSRPVFRPSTGVADLPFLTTSASLRLVGLEVDWTMSSRRTVNFAQRARQAAVFCESGTLDVERCRILCGTNGSCLGAIDASVTLRQSELTSAERPCLIWLPHYDQSLTAIDCQWQADRMALVAVGNVSDANQAPFSIKLQNTQIRAAQALLLTADLPLPRYAIEARESRFEVGSLVLIGSAGAQRFRASSTFQRRRLAQRMVDWRESDNVYQAGMDYLTAVAPGLSIGEQEVLITSLDEWWRFCGAPEGISREVPAETQ